MRASLITATLALLVISSSMALAQGWAGDDIWGPENVANAAKPTWFGASGMIVVPTAQTVNPQAIQAHYHSVRREADADGASGDDWYDLWGGNVGLTDGLEAGVTRVVEEDQTIFQAKYNFRLGELLDNPDLPDVAIGSRDIGDKINRVLYVTVTKDLVIKQDRTAMFRATVGYGDTVIPGAPLDGVFGGIDFTPFDYSRVQVEYDGENVNASVTYWWAQWLATEVGLLDGDFGWGVNAATSF